MKTSVTGRGPANRKGMKQKGAFRNRKKVCVAGIRSERKLKGRPRPGRVLGAIVTVFDFILTGVKTPLEGFKQRHDAI